MPGIDDADRALTALEVLAHHIRGVNAASHGESAASMVDGLAPDCVMRFEGIPVGPFEGRQAIAAAYAENPPSDQCVLRDVEVRPGKVSAVYAWATEPEVPAGRLTLELSDGLVTAMTIDYWRG